MSVCVLPGEWPELRPSELQCAPCILCVRAKRVGDGSVVAPPGTPNKCNQFVRPLVSFVEIVNLHSSVSGHLQRDLVLEFVCFVNFQTRLLKKGGVILVLEPQ